ncbi:MAG: ribosomal-processing cysteine protease Prp [Acholeplasmatales bacterium]|jgi:uncharacterized protein YsxB (DUF464 family)|nr:ribosomal-processing cysteine protease Prp [Acholeplasmatales bacterium]
MIRYYVIKDDYIKQIVIRGHSAQNKLGRDIVCASVSTLIISSINLIIRLRLDELIEYEQDNGYASVVVSNFNETLDTILINLEASLDDLENQYSAYIKKEKK